MNDKFMSLHSNLKCPKCDYVFKARLGVPHWISEDHSFHPVRVKSEIQQGLYGEEMKSVLDAMNDSLLFVEEAVFHCKFCKNTEVKQRISIRSKHGTYSNHIYTCKCGLSMHLIPYDKWGRIQCPHCHENLIEEVDGIQ